MPQWTPVILKGDYAARQKEANRLSCICYYEEHKNSYTTTAPMYGLVQVAHNASAKSHGWAERLAARWTTLTGLPTRKRQTKPGERGNANIKDTAMPAILGEVGPISHAAFDDWLDKEENRALLALSIAESIMEEFPNGGLVGLSIGHLYKTSSPNDTGAADADPPGDPNDQTEGWLNADVIHRVAWYLSVGAGQPLAPKPAPVPRPALQPAAKAPAFPGRNFHARMDRRGRYLGPLYFGEALKPWQRQMKARGWNVGADDGVFGEMCYKVCRAFQAEKGLGDDGIVGKNTWAAAWTRPVT